MKEIRTAQAWDRYQRAELDSLQPVLAELGYTLDSQQVHLGGERHLTAGRKLVLLGRRASDGLRVVIKASSHASGIAEIEQELLYRSVLEKVNFAYHVFLSPPVVLNTKVGTMRILVTEYIAQERAFLERPLEEQFFLALKAFEGLEGVHATTYGHSHGVQRVLGMWTSATYCAELSSHLVHAKLPVVRSTLEQALQQLHEHAEIVDRYAGFLTHWDLVPHNLRVAGHDIYLLDHSSLKFGNKYESWARFINFMALYNPQLEASLVSYVDDNRGVDQALLLKLMRLYRLAELVWYYSQTLDAAEGNLQHLNHKRVVFWAMVFESVLHDRAVPATEIQAYRSERDALRDDAEKLRQAGLH